MLLGSQSRCYFRPAGLLFVSSLIGIGPLAVTTTTTANVVRVAAFALPTVCASAAAYHQQQPPPPQQQQRHCPSSSGGLHPQQPEGRRRRRQRRTPMAHLLSTSAAAAPAAPESLGESSPAAAAAAAASTAPSLEALHAARKESAAGSGLELDGLHMRRALELAAKGLGRTRPNPAVGCVILDKDGRVVGEGFHPRAGEPHAEVRFWGRGGDPGTSGDQRRQQTCRCWCRRGRLRSSRTCVQIHLPHSLTVLPGAHTCSECTVDALFEFTAVSAQPNPAVA